MYVIDSLAYGGAEHSLVALLPALAERGTDVTVICLAERRTDLAESVREAGAKLLICPVKGVPGQVRWLRRQVKESGPDIVHTTLWRSDLVGRLATVRLRPCLLTSVVSVKDDDVRAKESGIAPWKLRVALSIDRHTGQWWTDHYHAVSPATRQNAHQRLRVPYEKITVIPRGRDPLRFLPADESTRSTARAELNIPEDLDVLLHVGRQEPAKGLSHLVDAYSLLRQVRPQSMLLLAGSLGTTTNSLRRQIERLELSSHVSLLGRRSDVASLLAAADVFVLPSLWEGLPNAVIEAMATGTAVVATDIAGVRDAVEPEATALLAKPADPEDLARQLLTVLADDELRSRLGTRGRELFLERYTIDRVAELTLALYAELVSTPVAGRASVI